MANPDEMVKPVMPEPTPKDIINPEVDPMPAVPEVRKQTRFDRIKQWVSDNILAGIEYRDKFKPDWDDIEGQIRQVHPANWERKEDWQTKVYIGLQCKAAETAYSSLNSMVFPSKRFFEIRGVESRDREEEGALEDLFAAIMDQGGFYFEKDYMLEESVDLGTGFIKTLAKPERNGIQFIWRSVYDCIVDPEGGHNFDNHRFWVDCYKKVASWIVDEINKGDASVYNPDLMKQALEGIVAQASGLKNEDLASVRNIDGTGDLSIPATFKDVMLYEYWGLCPEWVDENDESKGYKLVWKKVAMLNRDYIISIEENEYQGIPAVPAKIKPRKYDFYGKGYLLTGKGIQELINSMICLGFDSMKISSMDIIICDQNAIADQASIQYRPLAVWKVKGPPSQAVLMTRQSGGISAMRDILNGISLLDRVHQDVTGVTRHAEGSPTIDGKQGEQTLGEYQLKLQAVDKRFFSVAKRFEEEFVRRLLRQIYKIVLNPKMFTQEAVDRILGTKLLEIVDPATQQKVPQGQIPKLVLANLTKNRGEMGYDFNGSGVSQFSERQRTLERLEKALQMAVSNPTLTAMTNIDVLWKRIFQASEIPDWDEVIKSPEQMKQMMEFIRAQMAGAQVQQGGGMPPQQGAE